MRLTAIAPYELGIRITALSMMDVPTKEAHQSSHVMMRFVPQHILLRPRIPIFFCRP